jgi:predicted 3-demethylubiquinone-9 3-methyltransferase (glyoxalase superfamily)
MSVTARIPKAALCLWYNHDAEDAAKFYARTFPGSSVGAVWRAPGGYPDGKEGDALVVEFTVLGVPCIGLNGGQESQCGWCKDRWGLSWQITPKALTEALARGGDAAKRAFAAMMTMKKIDVAAIEASVHADA